MSSIPVIVGGAAKDAVPSVIIGGVEKKIYDAYVIVGGAAKLVYKSATPYTRSGSNGNYTWRFVEPIPVSVSDLFNYHWEDLSGTKGYASGYVLFNFTNSQLNHMYDWSTGRTDQIDHFNWEKQGIGITGMLTSVSAKGSFQDFVQNDLLVALALTIKGVTTQLGESGEIQF